jgi:hypothetical protein
MTVLKIHASNVSFRGQITLKGIKHETGEPYRELLKVVPENGDNVISAL